MKYNLNLKTIRLQNDMTLDQLKAEIFKIFDEDDNGNNGEEYLEQEAKEKGYSSNAEYFIMENMILSQMEYIIMSQNEKVYDFEKIIPYAYRSDYYIDYKADFTYTTDGIIISIATITDI